MSDTSTYLLSDLTGPWRRSMKTRNLADKTIETYLGALDHVEGFLGSMTTTSDLTALSFKRFHCR